MNTFALVSLENILHILCILKTSKNYEPINIKEKYANQWQYLQTIDKFMFIVLLTMTMKYFLHRNDSKTDVWFEFFLLFIFFLLLPLSTQLVRYSLFSSLHYYYQFKLFNMQFIWNKTRYMQAKCETAKRTKNTHTLHDNC